jgi:hypothetical protein
MGGKLTGRPEHVARDFAYFGFRNRHSRRLFAISIHGRAYQPNGAKWNHNVAIMHFILLTLIT